MTDPIAEALAAPCARCGHDAAWVVSPVRESGQLMLVENDPPDLGPRRVQSSYYAAVVCARCGYTILWARDFLSSREPVDARAACADCGDVRAWRIDPAPDADAPFVARIRVGLGPRWFGTIGVELCCGCGRARWTCDPDDVFDEDRAGTVVSPAACPRCHGERLRGRLHDQHVVTPYGRAIAIGQFHDYGEPYGRFVADVCVACDEAEWYGVELHELQHRPEIGVTLVRRTTPSAGGPYR